MSGEDVQSQRPDTRKIIGVMLVVIAAMTFASMILADGDPTTGWFAVSVQWQKFAMPATFISIIALLVLSSKPSKK